MSKKVLLTEAKIKLSELNAIALYQMFYDLELVPISKSDLGNHNLEDFDLVIGFGKEVDKINEKVNVLERLPYDILIINDLHAKHKISASLKFKLREYFKALKFIDSDRDMKSKIGTFTYYVRSLENISKDKRECIETLLKAVTLGIRGIISLHKNLNDSVDVWNNCNFEYDKVAINNSPNTVNNWKELAKMDEIDYFITPDNGTSSWAIISYNSNKNPLKEGGSHYWMHPSKFMAKFNTYDEVMLYLKDFILV